MKSSLIIATYNWPQALNLCLKSVMNQTVMPNEIVIADDGSKEDTKQLIDGYRAKINVPIIHVWQEDMGFRLSKIRNKSFAIASGEYLIQVDGDLVLHKKFVENHLKFAREGSFVVGSRVIMSEQLTKRLQEKESIKVTVWSKGITNFLNGLYLPFLSKYQEHYKKGNLYYGRGCNMAFWKKNIIKVNGYNEKITGWGLEDTELSCRLQNSGVERRTIKNAAIVFHQFHPECPRNRVDTNDSILQETIAHKLKYCELGVAQYL